jgi:hypothetical protein
MNTVNIGYNNSVSLLRIIAVISSKGSAARKTRNEASLSGKLVEATEGKKTRSMIVMDSGHLVLSIFTCETLNDRIYRTDMPVKETKPKLTVNINGGEHEITN